MGRRKYNRKLRLMSNKRLISYAKREYGNDVTRSELAKKDHSLYDVISDRGLLGELKRRQRWKGMGDDELLISYAKREYGEDVTKAELLKKDKGLYGVIWRRGLLGQLNSSRENRTRELEGILDEYVGGEK